MKCVRCGIHDSSSTGGLCNCCYSAFWKQSGACSPPLTDLSPEDAIRRGRGTADVTPAKNCKSCEEYMTYITWHGMEKLNKDNVTLRRENKRLREVIEEDEELVRIRRTPFIEWTEEQMKKSLECSNEKVWDVFIEMSTRQLRYYKNELEKADLRGDILEQYYYHVRLRIKELEVIIGKDAELRSSQQGNICRKGRTADPVS